MKSLFEKSSRESLIQRMQKLDAQTPPKWGKFNSGQMLAHLSDSLRMAQGKLSVAPRISPLRIWPINSLIIYWMPFPKGAPTAPELISRPAGSIDQERSDLAGLIDEFSTRSSQTDWPEHPAFGRLNAQDWSVLAYKHIDHHLTQFGV
ncbi:MAG: DUF1569 domain-containing protein [Acidobacteria bacterium]|nr:DUF1569 domain-containing protein [Acidobacteriota bacterium]